MHTGLQNNETYVIEWGSHKNRLGCHTNWYYPSRDFKNGVKLVINYCIKWVSAKAVWGNTAISMAKFLYECIWCHYGCPVELVSD